MSAERYVDRDEIAFLLGVEPRTITNYVKRHTDFPSRVTGKSRNFPIQKCLTWQRDRLVADAITDVAPPPPSDIAEAERRKAMADAEIAELKLAKLRSELVPVEAAAREIRDAFARVRSRLLSTPGEYAPQILHLTELPAAVLKLRELVDTVLAELQANAGGPLIDDDDEDAGEGEDQAA